MSTVTATRTVQDVLTYVKKQFGDFSGVQVTDTDIYSWINAAQIEIFNRNQPVKRVSTANLVAGQYKYTFPADILKVERLRISGVTVKYMSFQEADEYINQTDPLNVSSASPQVWYEYGGQFMFWPVPDASIVGGIEIFNVPAPTVVNAPANVLSVPDVYYNRLLEEVLRHAYEMDENFEAAQVKSAQFTEGLDLQSLTSSQDISTYPRITVLEEDM
jgi:hypothetical protein